MLCRLLMCVLFFYRIKSELLTVVIAGDRLGAVEVGLEHPLAELILDVGDDRAAQRTRAVGIVKALVGDLVDCLIGEGDFDAE